MQLLRIFSILWSSLGRRDIECIVMKIDVQSSTELIWPRSSNLTGWNESPRQCRCGNCIFNSPEQQNCERLTIDWQWRRADGEVAASPWQSCSRRADRSTCGRCRRPRTCTRGPPARGWCRGCPCRSSSHCARGCPPSAPAWHSSPRTSLWAACPPWWGWSWTGPCTCNTLLLTDFIDRCNKSYQNNIVIIFLFDFWIH